MRYRVFLKYSEYTAVFQTDSHPLAVHLFETRQETALYGYVTDEEAQTYLKTFGGVGMNSRLTESEGK